jgi:hypothetical protein
MPRDFDQVRCDLESIVFYLKNADHDHKIRRQLLKKLRLLLEEADRLMSEEDF